MAETRNRDLFFKRITERIAERDFTGYAIQYPPLFSVAGATTGGVRAAWRSLAGKMDNFGVYVHIPFCRQRCSYCRYAAEALPSAAAAKRYLAALRKEASAYGSILGRTPVRTLYIGGGTPALLSEAELRGLFSMLKANFDLSGCRQFAFEGNPDFLTPRKLALLKSAGVNRLTIGVQTLDPRVLLAVNRYQSEGAYFKCVAAARAAGIEYVNVDLLVGLPEQTMTSVVHTLKQVLTTTPDMVHIHSFYPTPLCGFTRDGHALSREDMRRREMMVSVCNRLVARAGYRQSKFDAWGRGDGARNLQLSDAVEHISPFLGLGAAALSHASGKVKYVNVPEAALYCRRLEAGRLPVFSAQKLSRMDEMVYFVTASLRYGALDRGIFQNNFGADVCRVFRRELAYLSRRGKVRVEKDRVVSLMANLGEYQVYTKYFYGRKVLRHYEKDLCWKDQPFDTSEFKEELRYLCL